MNKIYFLILVISTHFTSGQPTMVLDINSGFSGSSPQQLYSYDGLLYFSADDSSGSNTKGEDLGRELWVTDGTESGTMLLKNINPGSLNSTPNTFFEFNNQLYFSANAGSGSGLFTTDGTESGTQAVGGVGSVESPVLAGGIIYYKSSDNKLYHFNGTTSQPVAGSGSEYIQGNQLVVLNGLIYAYINISTESNTYGTELYSYNPNTDSFQIVADIGGGILDSEVNNLILYGNDLYFTTFSESEIWKSDGTLQGTEVVILESSNFSSLNNFIVWDSKLFFEGDNGTGDQLWVYDQATDNVTNLSNLESNANHDPSDYTALGDWLYYSAKDSNDSNKHLWRTNGTEVFQLDNTINGVDEITVLNDKLYFEGNNGTNGNELFILDTATLSIKSISERQLAIHPNPTSTTLNISSDFTIETVQMFDFFGKLVFKGNVVNQLDVRSYESGIYFLRILSGENEIIKKIIINN